MKKVLILSSTISALLLTACGGGSSDTPDTSIEPKPSTYIPSQYKSLKENFTYVKDPLSEVSKNHLYDLSYWVSENPLALSGYSYLYNQDNKNFKTQYYSTNSSSSNNWRLDPRSSLVFNIEKNKWVETANDLAVSEGPVGSEGIKTLHIQSDTGIKYYTLTEKDLSGLNIAEGINKGFGNGIPLPTSIKNQYFSSGAKAYAWVIDITQPTYSIRRTHYVFSSDNELHPILTCSSVTSYCSSTASNLEQAVQHKAWYNNSGNTGYIRINDNQTADVKIYDSEQKQNLSYQIQYEIIPAKSGVPKHILFTASDSTTEEVLRNYFSSGDNQLAWYEYNNQVVQGEYALPIRGLQSTRYSYNKVAVNDILTNWNPAKNPVLE